MPAPPDDRAKILILGGTAEAHALATSLVAEGRKVVTSLAGRTADPALPPGEIRIGGFGGVDGLAAYLVDNAITRVIDATHPFATRISENARLACMATGVPLESHDRPGWERQAGDDWRDVASLEEAATALPAGARVFLALGRQHLEAFEALQDCHFVIRMVDAPARPLPFASADLVLGKPSCNPADEAALFRRHAVTHLACRNSGGAAGYGKIAAARALGLPVLMLRRSG